MVDPSKLIAGAMAVYGAEKFHHLYGDIVSIDSSRIIEADDNFVLDFKGRERLFIDTPGHARHHFCIWDQLTESMFTGDTFGLSYREFDTGDEVYVFPTTTPVQFDPEELIKSIFKLMEYKPKRVCLTHFGAIKPTTKVTDQLITGIKFLSNLAKQYASDSNAEALIQSEMMGYFLMQLQRMGVKDQDFCKQKLQKDVELNTQGLIYWQQKLASNQH
jgi:glyoxylase-like metal-dependent hydrolase (beta-lactamase superfamily II)